MRLHQQKIPAFICIPKDICVPKVVYLEDEDIITTPSRSRSAKVSTTSNANNMSAKVGSTRRRSHTGILPLPLDGFAAPPPPTLRRWESNETKATSNSTKQGTVKSSPPAMPKRQESFSRQHRRASAPTPLLASHMRDSRWLSNVPSCLQ